MTFPGTDYGEPWRTVGTLSPTVEIHSSERWESGQPPFVGNIWRTTDADRIVACINALAGLDPAKLAALLDATDKYLEAWPLADDGSCTNEKCDSPLCGLRGDLFRALADLRGAAS